MTFEKGTEQCNNISKKSVVSALTGIIQCARLRQAGYTCQKK